MGTFKNADVAAKYDFVPKGDPVVHVPGGKNSNGWKSNLSNITMDIADRLHDDHKSNVLKLKVGLAASDDKKLKPEKIKSPEKSSDQNSSN